METLHEVDTSAHTLSSKASFLPVEHTDLRHQVNTGLQNELLDGRGEGNCFPADQLLCSPHGLLYVSEAFDLAGLKATCSRRETPVEFPFYNERGEAESTSNFTHNGRRKVLRLTTRIGGTVKATANQPLYSMNNHGWAVKKKINDIKCGDHLMIQRSFDGDIGSPGIYPDNALYFFGVSIADAWLGRNTIRLCNDDPVVQEAIVKHGSELFGMPPRVYGRTGNTGSLAYHFNSQQKVGDTYVRLGWEPCVAKGKKLGRYIRTLDKGGIAAVLRGYFDCECSISDIGSVDVTSASWNLLHEVKTLLLLHFGIIANLKRCLKAEYPGNEYWTLHLYGGEAETYAREIGFRSEIRQAQAKACLGKARNPNLDVIPNLGHFLTAIHESSDTTREHVHLVRDYKGDEARAAVTYQRLGRILSAKWEEGPALERLREIYETHYYYDEVTKVEMLESEPTFDFSMPYSHSIIVNGFVARSSDDRVAAALAAGPNSAE
jgi:intein/homing endonuclease